MKCELNRGEDKAPGAPTYSIPCYHRLPSRIGGARIDNWDEFRQEPTRIWRLLKSGPEGCLWVYFSLELILAETKTFPIGLFNYNDDDGNYALRTAHPYLCGNGRGLKLAQQQS